jgi:hypothetical protein
MNPQRRDRGLGTAVILAMALLGAASIRSEAHAQAWLPDRAYTEGPGIRAGDLEIHPGIAVRGGYDNNVFKADGERRAPVPDANGNLVDPTQKRQDSAILAVTPHIYLSTLSEQRRTQGEDRAGGPLPSIAFRGGLATTYFHYFTSGAPKNLEIDTDLQLSILPGRPFSIDLQAGYLRNVRPFTQYAGFKNAYVYDTVTPRARFNFGSRSRVLTAYVGYAPRINLYENAAFNYLNSYTHGAEVGAAWKFLPNTALVYDGVVEYQNYSKDNTFATISPVIFADNTRFRTRMGINGALTRTLALRVLAGYALVAIRNDRGDGARLDDHEDGVGEAVLSWAFGGAKTGKIEAGYQRDLLTSALGGWTRLDRGFATIRTLLGGVFMLSLEGGVSGVEYGRLWGYDRPSATPVSLGTNSDAKRHDVRVDGALRGEYRVTNWLSFMADVSAQAVITDFQYAVYTANGGAPIPDPAKYWTVIAFGGVRAHY